MTGVGRNKRWRLGVGLVGCWLLVGLLAACGQDQRPTPDYSNVLTPADGSFVTVTAPFQAATNITPEITDTPLAPGQPTPTASSVPNTPIIKPTPTTPAEGTLTSDDLGTGVWSDTEALWAPGGDIFVLHVLREGVEGDFYYLIRPPDSIQGSFRLSRAAFGTMSWSADGRYLLYIERDGDATAGAVKLIDMQRDPSHDRKLIAGPCTGASWLPGPTPKVVATCGLAIYQLNAEATTEAPDVIFKLDNNRFPGSTVDLSLLFQALPSPDGQTLAIYGVRRQKGPIPLGDIGFYNITSKKLDILERNNRPVTMVNWTPDSKYLILRNLTGDWAIPYTFDYYLADPNSLKITQNLTKSNDKCDPVLGTKPDCQGQAPSSIQSNRVLFAPDGEHYFFSGQRWVARPNAALTTAERLSSTKIGGKVEQLTETPPGEKIVGLTWLPNGHYFYSVGFGNGQARAVLDGKSLEIKGGQIKVGPKATPLPTKSGAAMNGFSVPEQATPPPTLIIVSPPTTVPQVLPTAGPPSTATLTAAPRGTSLLGFETVTAQAGNKAFTPPPEVPVPQATPVPVPTRIAEPSPTPSIQYPRPAAYYISPTGNWILAIERVAATDKVVQFQVRLIPFSLK